MKKLSCLATKIIGNLSSPLSIYIQLKSSWTEIIGKELENFLILNHVKYTGKNELSIFIKILSSASLIAKNNSGKILKSISNLLGIPHVKLIFQHTSVLNTPEVQELGNQEVINANFENESKNTLEGLKTEIQDAA